MKKFTNEELKEAKDYLLETWELVKNIPKNRWCINFLYNRDKQCCFRGHNIRIRNNNRIYNYNIINFLFNIDDKKLSEYSYMLNEYINNNFSTITEINDFGGNFGLKYRNFKHPKDRIRAFIEDIKNLKLE